MTRTRSIPKLALAAVFCIAPSLSLRADNTSVTLAVVPSAYLPGFQAIEEAELRAWISFLASPELLGRESGRPEYDVAARFAASMFQRFGVQPAGDRDEDRVSYFQTFELARLVQHDETFLRLEVDGKTESFELGDDFRIRGRRADVDWKGPWVFIDLAARAEEIDVRKHLEAAGLADHIPIVLTRSEQFSVTKLGLKQPTEGRALVISDRQERRARGPARGRATLPSRLASRSGSEAQTIYLRSRVADRILSAVLGTSVAERRKVEESDEISVTKLADLRMHISARVVQESAPTRNVIGVIEGSDPKLKDEYVCIGAHLDHVGQDHGQIFFGADDNASGSSGVLAIGRAIARSPHRPRRSVLLALWGAEELGLLGSRHFTENPLVPMEKIVTYINLDMIGRDEESDEEKADENRNVVHVVGSRKRSTELHEFIESRNRMVGLTLEEDEERVFGRSDQLFFDRSEIPVAFFFTGFHKDYHRPTDTIDKLNYAKLTRIVRLAYLVVHGLADLDERPAKAKRERF